MSKLSDRVRADVEAAPWVIVEIKKLEKELEDVYLEMKKIRPGLTAIFDSDVWNKIKN